MKRLSALHFLVGVVALVIGLAVGGLGPRAEIRALQAQIDAMGECESGSNVGSEIANVFRGRPWDEDRERPRQVTRFAPDPEVPGEPDPANTPEPENGFQITIGDDGEAKEPENLEEGLDMAREAMELRYAQARAALVEDANPSDQQLSDIDASMARMNDTLMGLATDLVDQFSEGEPSRRDTMLYAAETLDVVLSAEDELRASLTDEQIAALQDESLDPLSYVDPAIVDVLAQLDRQSE